MLTFNILLIIFVPKTPIKLEYLSHIKILLYIYYTHLLYNYIHTLTKNKEYVMKK